MLSRAVGRLLDCKKGKNNIAFVDEECEEHWTKCDSKFRNQK
jgi:hypothetical protein